MSILESAQAQVEAALMKVPPDKHAVWVTTVDTTGVVRSGIACRSKDDRWTFGAEAAWNFPAKTATGFAYLKVEF